MPRLSHNSTCFKMFSNHLSFFVKIFGLSKLPSVLLMRRPFLKKLKLNIFSCKPKKGTLQVFFHTQLICFFITTMCFNLTFAFFSGLCRAELLRQRILCRRTVRLPERVATARLFSGTTWTHLPSLLSTPWAAIQRRGSILAWTVILSVYGADTIAIDLSLSALISWFMNSIIGLLNNSYLHATISIINKYFTLSLQNNY